VECRDYIANFSRVLGINVCLVSVYETCDIKPMYGDMYCGDIKGDDDYGFGDLDVIYGNIRKFYDRAVRRCRAQTLSGSIFWTGIN